MSPKYMERICDRRTEKAIIVCEQECNYPAREILKTMLVDTEEVVGKAVELIDKIRLQYYLQSKM